jgi:arylsulfatase A-like enzyme
MRVAAAGLALGLLACGPAPRKNVLLVVIDTCRADRMSLYGYDRDTTPQLERLAAQGVVFDQALTHVPQTLPAVATLLTSTLPSEHGVRVNGLFRLPDSALTLAEWLRDAGWSSAAFVSGFPLDPRFRADQGFDHYDADFRDSILTRTRREGAAFQGMLHRDFEQRADEATAKAIAWLDAHERAGPERPFFLLVHYFDPHQPYTPPPAYRVGLDPYDGELAFTDAEIGRVVERLRSGEVLDETLVVVVGDHGEVLDPARPKASHAGEIEDAVLRVPLLLRLPGALPRGARVPAQVALLDVAPTILDLLGMPVPDSFRGRSLLPVVRGERAVASPRVPFETLYWKLEKKTGLTRYGVRTETHKYVLDIVEEDGGRVVRRESLFDLARDPREEENLLADPSPDAAQRDVLRSLRRETAALVRRSPRAEPLPLTPDAEERLRSLGYLGS